MAFEAEGECDWTPEQLCIRGTVRIVAGLASLHPHRRVFEHKRPPLIDVALKAGLLVIESVLDHAGANAAAPGGGERTVGIVAIGALNGAFIHPMF